MTDNDLPTIVSSQKTTNQIGRYRIIEKPIGSGGMATVYKVEDEDGNLYALKELHPELSRHRDFVRRFRREFELASTMIHPGLVRYHDLFEDQLTWYLLLDFIDGITLKDLLRRKGPVEVKTALAIARQLLSALGYLHDNGLVHRDIKPSNIILTFDGRVKLADFGVAKQEGDDYTRQSMLIGTPSYMAPELFGKSGSKDHDKQADIYSFGIVLYELLTRKKPFSITAKDDIFTIVNKIQSKNLNITLVNAPQKLEEIIARAIAFERHDRYQSANDFRKAMESIAPKQSEEKALIFSLVNGREQKREKNRQTTPEDERSKTTRILSLIYVFTIVLFSIVAFLFRTK